MTNTERWIVIPRWFEFQHRDAFRTDRPPWIKNLTRLVGDDDYLALTIAQRGILHGLWVTYASQLGVLSETGARQALRLQPADARRFTGNLEALNRAGFIEFSASKPAPFTRNSASTEEKRSKISSLSTSAGVGGAPPAAKAAATRRNNNGDPYHCPICREGFRRLRMSPEGKWADKFSVEGHLIDAHDLIGDEAIDAALAEAST